MFPEISDIPDKYGNLVLMSSLSVFHEDRIKSNKLTRCYYAMSMFQTCPHGRQNKSLVNV